MPFGIFLVILASALLHAFWNLLSKKSSPSTAFFTLMSCANAVCWSWTLFVVEINWCALGFTFFVIWLCSMVSENLYFIGIANAYKKLDISLGYPMVRAMPVVMIALIAFLLPPHKLPGWLGGLGLVIVCLGCLLMPLSSFRDFKLSNYTGPAFKYIIIGALGTTGYTIFDAEALKIIDGEAPGVMGALLYVFMIESGIALTLGSYTLSTRQGRQDFVAILKKTPFAPVAAGLAGSIAYALILYAMPRVAQLSYLQAFRQMSLPFGVILGVVLLKEKAGWTRWCGVTLILTGLIMIAFQ